MRSRLPVRLRGRGPALWLTLGAVAVGAVAATTIAYAGRQKAATNSSTTVRVQRGVIELTSSAAGTVQAAQSRGLSFSTGGAVTEVGVKAGDSVSAGQLLARIDGTSAQDDVTSAQSSVDSATNALARAQQTAPPASTNCQNSAAQAAPMAYTVAASASPSASAAPSASASPSAHGTPSTSASPPRQGQGQPGGKVTQPGTGGRTGTGDCAGTTGSTTGGSAGGTTGGSAGGRSGSGDSLMSAEQQLTNAKLALQLAQDKLAGTTITAPVAGRVLSVAGTVGTQQSPGDSGFIVLGEVADTAVRAEFSEADIAHLAVGQTATITLPNRDGAQIKGKVSQIDPAGTTSGRLVRYGVLIAFDEVPADLLLGQSANVSVVTASAADVRYVSSAAVRSVDSGGAHSGSTAGGSTAGGSTAGGSTVDSGSAVVTVRSAGHDERRTVQVGLRGDQYTEIRSGLQEGDVLVVAG